MEYFEKIRDKVSGIWDKVTGGIKGAVNNIIYHAENMVNWSVRQINRFIGGINRVVDVINKIPGVNLNHITSGRSPIPRLKGGDIIRGVWAMVGERTLRCCICPQVRQVRPLDKSSTATLNITLPASPPAPTKNRSSSSSSAPSASLMSPGAWTKQPTSAPGAVWLRRGGSEQMFEFNGRRADDPDLGIYRVLRVLFPLLPGTEDRFLGMPGMDGAYDFGRDLQPREIGVQFVLKQDSPENLFKYARKIAAWLNVSEVKRFIYDYEPDKYYMARPQGIIDFDRLMNKIGIIEVNFIAPDPFAYALEPKTTDTYPAVNAGTAPARR